MTPGGKGWRWPGTTASRGGARGSRIVAALAAAAVSTLAALPAGAADGGGEVDQFYGSFGTEIPIAVPSFHGIEPNVKLGYTSSPVNGWVGVGWGVSGSSFIQRSRKNGAPPAYDANDVFFLDGQELVASTSLGGTHATKIMNYTRISKNADDTWSAWGTNGVKATYTPVMSNTAASSTCTCIWDASVDTTYGGAYAYLCSYYPYETYPQYYTCTAGTSTTSTYRYAMTKVEDPHGNTANYSYWCDGTNDCYLDTITYNGVEIRFYRELRTTDPIIRTNGKGFTRTNYRLRSITVRVGGSLVRAYEMTYAASQSTGRSLLTAVQQFGRDATVGSDGDISGGTSLAPYTIQWQNDALSFGTASMRLSTLANGVAQAYGGDNSGDNWSTISTPDINGDGFSDVCWRGDTGYWCALGTANGTYGAASLRLSTLANSYSQAYGGDNSDDNYPTIRNADINADGKSDVCWRGDTGFWCALANGTSFNAPTMVVPNLANGYSQAYGGDNNGDNHPTIRMADIDGDGDSDVCWRGDTGLWCARSNGNGTFAAAAMVLSNLANGVAAANGGDQSSDNYPTIALPDINADRCADVCWRSDAGYFCALSKCDGTFATAKNVLTNLANGVAAASGGDNSSDNWSTISNPDINGDGAADVCWRGDNGYWCAMAKGDGTFDTASMRIPELANSYSQSYGGDNSGDNYPTIRATDMNGDGCSDVCWRGDTGYFCAKSKCNGTFYAATNVLYNLGNGYGSASGGDNSSDNYPTIQNPDLNGDGKPDICWRGDSGWWCATQNGKANDLVSKVSNGIGGTTAIEYKPSSAWSNTYLPNGMIIQTVAATTTTDGRGSATQTGDCTQWTCIWDASVDTTYGGAYAYLCSSYPQATYPQYYTCTSYATTSSTGGTTSRTDYTYQGGLWSNAENRFLGFRKVTGVLNAAGDYTETYYHQHIGCISKPETTYFKNATGQIYSYSSMTYAENTAPPYTSLMTDRWDYTCNLSSTCTRTLARFYYDTYGNVYRADDYGNYDVSGDERTATRGYVPNTTAYIVGLPSYEQVNAGIGTAGAVVQLRALTYDGNASNTVAPTKGDLTYRAHWNSTNGSYTSERWTYDQYGNQTAYTDLGGATHTKAYDSSYHMFVVSETNPRGWTQSYEYDYALGMVTARTDVSGQRTTRTYDALGRPVRVDYPGGDCETYGYFYTGNASTQYTRKAICDGTSDGLYKDSYFDGLGRVYKQVAEGGITVERVYSDAGRLWKESFPYDAATETAQWTVREYDAVGRVTRVTNPDGSSKQEIYGNDYVIHRDELGRDKVEWHTARGGISKIQESLPGQNLLPAITYDAMDRATTITDAQGNTTTAKFNSLGRQEWVNDPDSGLWTYQYDAAGNTIVQIDANGNRVEQSYDNMNRITSRRVFRAGVLDRTDTYTYDEANHGYSKGMLTTVSSSDGVTSSYTYDLRGQKTAITTTISGQSYTIQLGYDITGRQTSITYPDGQVVTYQYDSKGDLAAVPGLITSISYNARGQLTSAAYANGTTQTRTYDASRAWLTNVAVTRSGTSMLQESRSYNVAGEVTAKSSATHFLHHWQFAYDNVGRLTTATNLDSAGQSRTYSYDATGNMTYNSAVGAYTYPPAGSAHPHAVLSAGSKTYQYDAAGNMTSGAGRTMVYDGQNRLETVTTASGTETYVYDAEGVRAAKMTASSTTFYIGDYMEVTNGVVTKYYHVGGQVFAKSVSGAVTFLHTDGQGNTMLTTNSVGQESGRMMYAPFGEVMDGFVADSHRYTGQEADATGLYFMASRYYDPALARFTQADTLVPGFANPQSLNRYSYVLNNPVTYVDPSGHVPVVAAVVAVVSVGAATGFAGAIFITAVIGAACTIAGWALKSPLLSTIGGVLLGFAGGYVGPFATTLGATGAGILGATVSLATSPLSPLSPQLKQAIGWAYGIACVVKSLSDMAKMKENPQGGAAAKLDPDDKILTKGEVQDALKGGGELKFRVFAERVEAGDTIGASALKNADHTWGQLEVWNPDGTITVLERYELTTGAARSASVNAFSGGGARELGNFTGRQWTFDASVNEALSISKMAHHSYVYAVNGVCHTPIDAALKVIGAPSLASLGVGWASVTRNIWGSFGGVHFNWLASKTTTGLLLGQIW